ncbi:MAG: ubiquinone/menaquinone biosynthesis methyltransferase [Dehalococcoidia bacterium]
MGERCKKLEPLLEGEAKAQYVEAMFSRIAKRYDLVNTVMTLGMHHRWRRMTAELAIAGLKGKAMDIGTGTGDLALALAARADVTKVIGVDFSSNMLKLAFQKAKGEKLEHKIDFILGDALSLSFVDDSFACATAGFTVRNAVDVSKMIGEMRRVVIPGGRVVILELTPLTPGNPLAPLVDLYLNGWIPLVGRGLARDRAAYSYLSRSVGSFPTSSELARLLERVGLRKVSYRVLGMGAVAIHWGLKER